MNKQTKDDNRSAERDTEGVANDRQKGAERPSHHRR